MRKSIFSLSLLALGVLLSACAPIAPAPTEDTGSRPPVTPPPPERPDSQEEQAPAPVTPEETREPSNAVRSLLEQGWERYNRDDFQGALGIAERAQRIDARSPEVYLLMASAQFSLYRLNLAEQLVRRGLAFSASGSVVDRQLTTLLGRITAGAR